MDYIFSEIIPDKDSLDFIPVKFVDRWGYINKNGNVMNMNVKETLVTNEKCSQEES